MDYEKLKALTVAETEARTQEMQEAQRLKAASDALAAAQAKWKAANDRYNAAKTTRERYIDEAIRQDAATEAGELIA